MNSAESQNAPKVGYYRGPGPVQPIHMMAAKDIAAYLEQQEIAHGAKVVREACVRYLRKRTYAGVEVRRRPVPRSWLKEAYVKQSGKCAICHKPMDFREATGDHIRPLAKGGEHKRYNIQAAHRSCNSSKNADDLMQRSKATGETFDQILGAGTEEDI